LSKAKSERNARIAQLCLNEKKTHKECIEVIYSEFGEHISEQRITQIVQRFKITSLHLPPEEQALHAEQDRLDAIIARTVARLSTLIERRTKVHSQIDRLTASRLSDKDS